MSITRANRLFSTGARSNSDREDIQQDKSFRSRWKKISAWGATLDMAPGAILRTVPEWDPKATYTPNELLLQAERFLCLDPKPLQEDPAVLRLDRLQERTRREIYNENGIPDPSIVQGLYWRSHPQGRSFKEGWVPDQGSTKEGGRNNASGFYR